MKQTKSVSKHYMTITVKPIITNESYSVLAQTASI